MFDLKLFFSKIFGGLVNKIATEPVFTTGLAIIALQTYQSAVQGGLGPEDALAASVYAVLTLLARQLVWPAVKIDATTQTPLAPVEPLGAPALGDPED